MNRNVEIIAIDHGWSHIKTRSTVFVSGVKLLECVLGVAKVLIIL